MITIISDNFVLEEKRELFLSLAKEIAKESRKEPGCIGYTLQQDIQDPLHFCLIEQWKKEEDIAKHNQTPHFQEIVPKMKACRAKQIPAYRFCKID